MGSMTTIPQDPADGVFSRDYYEQALRQRAEEARRSRVPDGRWLTVDPGEVHVGTVLWQGHEPVRAQEMHPDQFVDYLVTVCASGELELIVYEIFMLYGHKKDMQLGSTFGTAELIGVIKHVARRAGVATVGYQASAHKQLYKLKEYRPPVKPLRDWKSYGHGSHTKDAECLGLYHIRTKALKGRGY